MLESRTLSVWIEREWRQVYEAVWRPLDFRRWASGLSQSAMERDGDMWWRAMSSDEPIRIRFSEHNEFGVMDHWVEVGAGTTVYVPMRVVANGQGAEVLFTLFRQPDMSDEKFAADMAWVERDLLALKALAEDS
jgi:hypothetical protein